MQNLRSEAEIVKEEEEGMKRRRVAMMQTKRRDVRSLCSEALFLSEERKSFFSLSLMAILR
jgi:hypothetical protein